MDKVAWLGLLLVGCVPMVPQSSLRDPSPREKAAKCMDECVAMDMTLSAVVLVSDRAGCVCQPPAQRSAVKAGGAGATEMAVSMIEEDELAAILAAQSAFPPPPITPPETPVYLPPPMPLPVTPP